MPPAHLLTIKVRRRGFYRTATGGVGYTTGTGNLNVTLLIGQYMAGGGSWNSTGANIGRTKNTKLIGFTFHL